MICVVGRRVNPVAGILLGLLSGRLLLGLAVRIFFPVHDRGRIVWLRRRCILEILIQIGTVLLLVLWRESRGIFILDPSHGVSLGHDTAPMSG